MTPSDSDDLKIALEIAAKIDAPANHPEFTCLMVAAAVAGLRGFGMRHIRMGGLSARFDGSSYLDMRGSWVGCEGFTEHDFKSIRSLPTPHPGIYLSKALAWLNLGSRN